MPHDDKSDPEQLRRMRRAVDRKGDAARQRAEQEQKSIISADRPADEQSVRAKSSGHKKKTADKWNQ
jgi:hypothetical protein